MSYSNKIYSSCAPIWAAARKPVQRMPHIRTAQRLEAALDGSRARRRPEQACPPGSRLSIAREARRERLDAGRPAPDRDELLQPHVILTGVQRVRIVGRSTSF